MTQMDDSPPLPVQFASNGELLATIDGAIEKLGFGLFQFFVSMLCFYCWFCLGASISIAAIFSPTVKCDWQLSDTEEAAIAMVYYAGSACGCFILIALGDKMGRKMFLGLIFFTYVLFGILCGIPVSPHKEIGYPWLVMCRFGQGIAHYPGTAVVAVYLVEILPTKARGACIYVLQMFFGFGTAVSALFGLILIEELGWRWYSAILTTSFGIVAFLYILFIPESPRYLAMNGNWKKAQSVLRRIAYLSGKKHLMMSINLGSVKDEDKQLKLKEDEEFGIIKRLLKLLTKLTEVFGKEYGRITLLLIILWFTAAFLNEGTVWLPTAIFQHDFICGSQNSTANLTDNVACVNTTSSYYLEFAWTASADIPALILLAILIKVIRKKLNIALNYFGASVFIILLVICVPQLVTTTFFFLFRGLQVGAYLTLYVYSCEVYPTSIRGTAMGIVGTAVIVGNVLSPFTAQVLIYMNYYSAIGLYSGLAMIASVTSLFLPLDTKGKALN